MRWRHDWYHRAGHVTTLTLRANPPAPARDTAAGILRNVVVVVPARNDISGSAHAGAGAPARTASSCAANATPRSRATEARFAQSSREKIAVNGP